MGNFTPAMVERLHSVSEDESQLLYLVGYPYAGANPRIAREFLADFGLGPFHDHVWQHPSAEQFDSRSVQPYRMLRLPTCASPDRRVIVHLDGSGAQLFLKPLDDVEVGHPYKKNQIQVVFFGSDRSDPNAALAINEPGDVGDFRFAQQFNRVRWLGRLSGLGPLIFCAAAFFFRCVYSSENC